MTKNVNFSCQRYKIGEKKSNATKQNKIYQVVIFQIIFKNLTHSNSTQLNWLVQLMHFIAMIIFQMLKNLDSVKS